MQTGDECLKKRKKETIVSRLVLVSPIHCRCVAFRISGPCITYADFDKQLLGSFSSSLMWTDHARTHRQQYKTVIADDDTDISLPQRLIVIQSKAVSFL